MFEISVEDEIHQIKMKRPHVILLGAGASRAAFPSGESSGRRLPLMIDFTDIVPINDILLQAGISYRNRNFEEIYTELYTKPNLSSVCKDIENAVFDYFSSLSLPPEPTLYDHLVLSLRKKDVIATFNWDPFLIQAVRRNRIVKDNIPSILFLHGNVAGGYCQKDNVHGIRGGRCSKCNNLFEQSKLLYPVATKSYNDDPAIAEVWKMVELSLKAAFMVTIFGYGAPQSDSAAIKLLDEAWGGGQNRSMEQFEIIDIREKDKLVSTWEKFIHTHHYEVHESIYNSWLFRHPRRSGEAYWNQYLEAKFIEDHPLPREADFPELWEWFQPLLSREQDQ
ncbi:MAG: hypothetical protein ACYCT9_05400 [Leptospirillum sp.]